ncbi:hypothetical protein ACFV14_08355 [Streptomyces zaomyceticus]|uniref:hypothetical protein n=1 Tax=Streptomyces zaomyceticus TaxID=68286 RepID=UPI0036983A7A
MSKSRGTGRAGTGGAPHRVAPPGPVPQTGKETHTPPTDLVNGTLVHRPVADAAYTGTGGYGSYVEQPPRPGRRTSVTA